MKRVTRLEPAPPLAALDLYQDQVTAGHRPARQLGDMACDRFEAAASWERDAITAPITQLAALARIARASLTGKSPRTRRGRWRRDLEYLELVLDEAIKTLPQADLPKYGEMVAAWRAVEPRGFFGRYLVLRNRKRAEGREPAG